MSEPTDTLTRQHCEACRVRAPQVSDQQLPALQAHVPQWSLEVREGVRQLERVFKFTDYAAALAFTQRVGELAEAEDHHPLMLVEWGKVTVTWWTHAINGLHRNDFICAAKTDQLA